MTAQPNSTLKESPMNTTLIALFALSFSTDALADRGAVRTDVDRSSSSRSIASADSMGGGGDRVIPVNYWLTLESYPSDPADPELIEATFSGVWGENVGNMRFCWKEADQFGDACWFNNVKLTNGDGVWVGPSYNVSFQVGGSWWQGYTHYHQWTMDNDWMDQEEVDPIVCGVEYTFKLRNNPWHDDLTTTMPCPEIADAEDAEEEACEECPLGGWFDGAHCYVGSAPANTEAFLTDTQYGYSPEEFADCDFGDTVLRSGDCAAGDIPEGVDAFVWSNNWYYHPVCE